LKLISAASAVLLAYLAWGSRGWPLIHDVPLMHYIAWLIEQGAVPYRDTFDMNLPGAYLLHLAVLLWWLLDKSPEQWATAKLVGLVERALPLVTLGLRVPRVGALLVAGDSLVGAALFDDEVTGALPPTSNP